MYKNNSKKYAYKYGKQVLNQLYTLVNYNFHCQWNALNDLMHKNTKYVHAMKDAVIQKYVTIE